MQDRLDRRKYPGMCDSSKILVARGRHRAARSGDCVLGTASLEMADSSLLGVWVRVLSASSRRLAGETHEDGTVGKVGLYRRQLERLVRMLQ